MQVLRHEHGVYSSLLAFPYCCGPVLLKSCKRQQVKARLPAPGSLDHKSDSSVDMEHSNLSLTSKARAIRHGATALRARSFAAAFAGGRTVTWAEGRAQDALWGYPTHPCGAVEPDCSCLEMITLGHNNYQVRPALRLRIVCQHSGN